MFANKQGLDLEDSENVWVGISPGLAVSSGHSSGADLRVCEPWEVPHAQGGAGTAAVPQESTTGPHFCRV